MHNFTQTDLPGRLLHIVECCTDFCVLCYCSVMITPGILVVVRVSSGYRPNWADPCVVGQ